MKPLILLSPFVFASMLLNSIPLLQDFGTFEPILRGLSELPLVAGVAWLLTRQGDRHQDTIKSIMQSFSERAEKKDQFYHQLIRDLTETISEMNQK